MKTGPKRQSLLEKFERHVIRQDECWSWRGSRHKFGYGYVRHGDDTMLAHRISYELFVGPIPDGFHVLHKCDTPACTNPGHLYLGLDADNVRDKVSRNRQFRKLSEDDVADISMLRSWGVPLRVIAKEYGIHETTHQKRLDFQNGNRVRQI
jgi:hypothetical protein